MRSFGRCFRYHGGLSLTDAQAIAKYMNNDYTALIRKHGVEINSMPPAIWSKCFNLYHEKKITKTTLNELMEYYIILFKALFLSLDGQEEAASAALAEWKEFKFTGER